MTLSIRYRHCPNRGFSWRKAPLDGSYGFIHPDGGGGDVFVHISAVERSGLSQLYEGQKVSFEVETGVDGKTSAANLKVV